MWGTRRHIQYKFHFKISQNNPELPLTSKILLKVYPRDKINIKALQKKVEKRGRGMRIRKEKRENKIKRNQEKDTKFMKC